MAHERDTNTYEWHTIDIRIHTNDTCMTYEEYTNEIRLHNDNIRVK